MSDYEQHIGKARFIPAEDNIEDLCKSICDKENFEKSYHSDYREVLSDCGYKKYIVFDDGVYEIFDKKELDDYDDIFQANQNSQTKEIDFVLRYYNGGCGFDEAFREAIKNMKK